MAWILFLSLTTLCSGPSLATDEINVTKTQDILNIMKGRSEGSAMMRSTTTEGMDIKLYIKAVSAVVGDLKCMQECGMFSEGFNADVDRFVNILVNLPPTNGVSVTNNLDNLKAVTEEIRKFVSSTFFNTALLRAMVLRPDTQDVSISPIELLPEKMIPKRGLKKVASDYDDADMAEMDFETKSPFKGSSEKDEGKMDYFREDHLLHSSHLMFHTLGQTYLPAHRPNEKFAYMHRMLIYRYYIERHVIGLEQPAPLDSKERRTRFRSFYPNKLFSIMSPTKAFCTLTEEHIVKLEEFQSQLPPLLEKNEMTEELYVKQVQSDYHNYGHDFISDDCKENPDPYISGFLMESEFSARDPLFFRWHTEVEDVLKKWKLKAGYSNDKVSPPPGIRLNSVTLKSRCDEPNVVETFYDMRRFPIMYDNVSITIINEKILNHEDFTLTISLENAQKKPMKVIFRLFLGLEEFVNSGRWMIELDRWVYRLTGAQQETIVRKSTDSFLTEKTPINEWINYGDYREKRKESCAWPRNLYLPRGRSGNGTRFRLVVFVHDVAEAVNEGENPNLPGMFCGARPATRMIFDERSFGFPMDKEWSGIVRGDVLQNKVPVFGNISAVVTIIFSKDKKPVCARTGAITGQPAAVTTPAISVTPPTVTTPAVTTPAVTKPAVTTPAVTTRAPVPTLSPVVTTTIRAAITAAPAITPAVTTISSALTTKATAGAVTTTSVAVTSSMGNPVRPLLPSAAPSAGTTAVRTGVETRTSAVTAVGRIGEGAGTTARATASPTTTGRRGGGNGGFLQWPFKLEWPGLKDLRATEKVGSTVTTTKVRPSVGPTQKFEPPTSRVEPTITKTKPTYRLIHHPTPKQEKPTAATWPFSFHDDDWPREAKLQPQSPTRMPKTKNPQREENAWWKAGQPKIRKIMKKPRETTPRRRLIPTNKPRRRQPEMKTFEPVFDW